MIIINEAARRMGLLKANGRLYLRFVFYSLSPIRVTNRTQYATNAGLCDWGSRDWLSQLIPALINFFATHLPVG